ncbi:MAG TPA: hypothetical protein VNG35_07735 [Gemmatimonadales bacterium]|nr:hypothetical protein [Gemmatimonadales bacterium]
MKPMSAGLFLLAAFGAAACSDHSKNPTAPAYSAAAAPLAAEGVHQPGPRNGFGFNGNASGFPKGAVILTGGGSFNVASANNVVPTITDVHSGGGFSCTDSIGQGPLTGCATGQGVRWDTAQLLASTQFKCSLADGLKPAATDDSTIVLLADFYRAGDANDESFTAQMIVSERDLAPLIPGDQHLWVQGVGCGDAVVNFSK